MKIGDAISTIATPIARTFRMDCIDPKTNDLRPESSCAKRKAALNNLQDYFFKPKNNRKETMQFTVTRQIAIEASTPEEALENTKPANGTSMSFNVTPKQIVPLPVQRSGAQVPATSGQTK